MSKRDPYPHELTDTVELSGKQYWRSLDELAQTPEFKEFVEREFPAGASELSSPLSRRNFMHLMGASFALAGMAGCRRPEEKILPYSKAPEHAVIGLPVYYATTATVNGEAVGVLVESNDGRPTKIEGNPAHPASGGASSPHLQAAILDLYDPDRSTYPVVSGKAYKGGEREAGYDAALAFLKERQARFQASQGAGLHVLSGALLSPTVLRLREQLLSALPKARWHVWEPVSDDAIRAGSRLAFSDDLQARYNLDKADVILALDADPLGLDPDSLAMSQDFATRRRPEDKDDTMNRLYVVEPSWTVTGGSSDHRLRVRPSEVGAFALQLAAELAAQGLAMPAEIGGALPKGKGALDEKFVKALAKDLIKNTGKAVVIVGRNQPREIHALGHAINAALGATGKTVQYIKHLDAGRPLGAEALKELAAALGGGTVDTLVVLGGNPAYDAPADLDLEGKLKGGKTALVHLGLHFDETAKLAQLHLPRAHFLEAWGDAKAVDGTVSLVQPLIAPLHGGWSDLELLNVLLTGQRGKGYDLVRETWRAAQAQAQQAAPAQHAPAAGDKAPAGSAPAQPQGAQQAPAAPGGDKAAAPENKGGEKAAATKAAMAAGFVLAQAAPAGAAPAAQAAPAAAKAAPAAAKAAPAAQVAPAAGKAAPAAAAPAAQVAPAAAKAAPAAAPAGAAATAATPGGAVAQASGGPSALDLIFDASWKKILKDGLMAGSAAPTIAPTLQAAAVGAALSAYKPAAEGMEIVFNPSYSTYDGRYANNGWLQELPDPITKLTWDNAALLSARTARELGVDNDDMVRITVEGRSVEAAVYVQPGQADKTVTLTLGYGRSETGRIGKNAGFNAYRVRRSTALGFDGAQVAKTGAKYDDPRDQRGFDPDNPRDGSWINWVRRTGLVPSQDHFSQEEDEKWNQNRSYGSPRGGDTKQGEGKEGEKHAGEKHGGTASTANHHAVKGRPLVREADLEEFHKEPDFAKHAVHHPPLKSLWDERPYVGQQWGMAIDLSACTGCGACTIACQAENNIPIVGKAQVRKGREMHWIRVDRYFSGSIDDPEASAQPVPCMQCENAPCENVCPVAATVHSEDGLNDMVYNRCVGTRYCSNNCPYKVRRFNYLDWRNYYEEEGGPIFGQVVPVARLKYNPDVSLRSRGVIEKCTYCVQRIRGAQRDAKLKNVDRVADGVIEPACAQACPANAIVFGDITDPQSRVSQLKKSPRNYEILAEINTKPRTSYLARIRNQNPELRDHE